MIRRTSQLKRGAMPKRKTRVRSRNPKRAAANWKRAYGSPERVKWIKGQTCIGCGAYPTSSFPSVNAHTKNGGASRKADAKWIVPLCVSCHTYLHQYGQIFTGATMRTLDYLRAQALLTDARWKFISEATA